MRGIERFFFLITHKIFIFRNSWQQPVGLPTPQIFISIAVSESVIYR